MEDLAQLLYQVATHPLRAAYLGAPDPIGWGGADPAWACAKLSGTHDQMFWEEHADMCELMLQKRFDGYVSLGLAVAWVVAGYVALVDTWRWHVVYKPALDRIGRPARLSLAEAAAAQS